MDAVLGFRAHTGWAMAVALAGPAENPRVLAHARVELWEGSESPHAYHAAAKAAPDAGEQLVRGAQAVAARKAREALSGLRGRLDCRVVATALVLAKTRLPEELSAILRSHPLLHAAEGELFRHAIASASEAEGIPVTGLVAHDLYGAAAKALRLPEAELRSRLADLGRAAGKPWGQDEKESALVAWVALRRASA